MLPVYCATLSFSGLFPIGGAVGPPLGWNVVPTSAEQNPHYIGELATLLWRKGNAEIALWNRRKGMGAATRRAAVPVRRFFFSVLLNSIV